MLAIMSDLIASALVALFFILSSTAALVPSKPWVTTVHRRLASSSYKLTMYFDDVSRHSNGWKPGKLSKNGDVSAFHRSEQKHDAVKRMLLEYDAGSASVLSADEVLEQMQLWAQKSGAVGDNVGDKVYRETLGISVCDATSVVGCVANFWQAIVAVIDEHTDDADPTNNPEKVQSAEQIFFAIFPNCRELYDYKTMFTFVTALEFSKELCLHLGSRSSLTLFHPKFKNSPRMLSPEKHSPFPCTGLQFGVPSFVKGPKSTPPSASISTAPKATRRNSGTYKQPVDETEEDDNRIRDLDDQRNYFEVLFNSAAVSGSDGDDSVVNLSEFYAEELVDSTSKQFENELHLSKSNLPKGTVKGMLQTWINQNRCTDTMQRQQNRALKFIDTVANERWIISEHEIAEKVYADIWKAISDLYDIGCRIDKEYEARISNSYESRTDDPLEKSQTSNQIDDMKPQSRPFLLDRGVTDDQRLDGVQPVIRSSLFVSTKFCAFNAQSFKRFAITINAALKRLTNGQMFLEVFHPEYVGKKGCNSVMRRSPFPMIQICYAAKAETSR